LADICYGELVLIPAVSIIIVNWNGLKHLPRCLEALVRQTFTDFEVLVIDNGSTDKSVDGLEQRWPDIKVTRLNQNVGFAAANNLGAHLARGHWLALLNSDAFPEPDWLEKLLRAAERHPECSFFASRQLQANSPQLLDGAGDAVHISGLAWRRYAGYPAASFGLESREVFSPCAAAALYSRQVFLQVGGFDEDFFSYHEDVDLGFRLRLQGFRCLYVPDAVVKHIGSASIGAQSDFAVYHWQRNMVWSFVQNMPSTLFWEALPAHLLANLVHCLKFSLKGRGSLIWKAKRDAMRGFSKALQKRQEIQKRRTISNAELIQSMERGWLQPYLLGCHVRKIRRTLRSST
jgi:GT2 family glycosyltransferase